jgi:hypothetical protein
VPRGDLEDVTRSPAEFDAVAEYLTACGMEELEPAPLPVREAASALL